MSETPSASWRQWAEEKPAWIPPDNAMQATHLGKFLASHRLNSVQELREKAAHEPDWFWQSVEKSLEWPWLHPYSEVLSIPAGKPWPRWFRGGSPTGPSPSTTRAHPRNSKTARPLSHKASLDR